MQDVEQAEQDFAHPAALGAGRRADVRVSASSWFTPERERQVVLNQCGAVRWLDRDRV